MQDHPVPECHIARLWVCAAGIKKAVVKRDVDLLAPEEFQEHAAAVAAAVLEELQARVDRKCFSRRPRSARRPRLQVGRQGVLQAKHAGPISR
eukprot:8429795-Pyramimonas_sp.AAC.1